jgi:hypothetical protein
MLDHIAVGPFAEQPARKDAIPFVVALLLHAQLNESAGFGRVFPRRRRLARAQPHDRAADARDLAGFHLQLFDQSVAFVEQAEHRDALLHRRRTLDAADLLRHSPGLADLGRLFARAFAVAGLLATRKRGGGEQRNKRGPAGLRHARPHSAPGRQAS